MNDSFEPSVVEEASENPGRSGDRIDELDPVAPYAADLIAAVGRVTAQWVVRSVVETADAVHPGAGAALVGEAARVGEQARVELVERLTELLGRDVEAQPRGPLVVLRDAVSFPTEGLRAAGIPAVDRDEVEVRAFPDDVYGLVPASFADFHPDLSDPGVAWGAAKAHVIMARRRGQA